MWMLIIYAVLLAVMMVVMAPKPPSQDNPEGSLDRTTTAERGTYVRYTRGRKRVGGHLLWLGRLRTFSHNVNRSPVIDYSQEGWVALAVGPAWCLRSIRENGKAIYTGWIDRTTHPSGTFVRTGRFTAGPPTTPTPGVPITSVPEGFFIYWGEDAQPVNTYLGAAARVGISSRWPSLCYLVWAPMHLGQGTTWPQLTYDIELRPEHSQLASTGPFIYGTYSLTGTTNAVYAVTNGAAGAAKISVTGNQTTKYRPLRTLLLAGNTTAANGAYTILTAVYSTVTKRTVITVQQAISGSNNSGTIQAYAEVTNDGPNGGHVLDEMLFAPWPWGLAIDRSEWDTSSLEALGILCYNEGTPSTINAQDGKSAADVTKELMLDLGFAIPFDVRSGLYRVKPLRIESTIPAVPEEAICRPLPEITTNHQERSTTVVIYTWEDRAHKFRTGTIAVGDDGQGSIDQKQKPHKTTLATVTDEATAMKVSERRALEEQSEWASYDLVINREGRLLYPAEVFTAEGIDPNLRVVEVEIEPLSSAVKIKAVTDFMSDTTSSYEALSGVGDEFDDANSDPQPDWANLPMVPPSAWGGGPPPEAFGETATPGGNGLWLPRIRYDETTTGAEVWVSKDDVTYELAGRSIKVAAGGTLVSSLPNTGTDITTGPDVTLLGPDVGLIRDLAGDAAAWAAGEQMLLCGDEIMFLEGMDVVDDATITLRGIKRAQHGTAYAFHDVDEIVRIVQWTDVEIFKHRWLVSGETIYVKVAPMAAGVYDLDNLEAMTYTVP